MLNQNCTVNLPSHMIAMNCYQLYKWTAYPLRWHYDLTCPITLLVWITMKSTACKTFTLINWFYCKCFQCMSWVSVTLNIKSVRSTTCYLKPRPRNQNSPQHSIFTGMSLAFVWLLLWSRVKMGAKCILANTLSSWNGLQVNGSSDVCHQ